VTGGISEEARKEIGTWNIENQRLCSKQTARSSREASSP
jgi:hypothetical protein